MLRSLQGAGESWQGACGRAEGTSTGIGLLLTPAISINGGAPSSLVEGEAMFAEVE